MTSRRRLARLRQCRDCGNPRRRGDAGNPGAGHLLGRAWTWTTTDNAAVIGTGVQDPAHNFAFEVHQYLDADGSGTHPGVVSATSASSA